MAEEGGAAQLVKGGMQQRAVVGCPPPGTLPQIQIAQETGITDTHFYNIAEKQNIYFLKFHKYKLQENLNLIHCNEK